MPISEKQAGNIANPDSLEAAAAQREARRREAICCGGRMGRWMAGISLVALIVAGCRTIEDMAPPVGPTMADLGMRAGHPMDSLQRGRGIYLDQCIKCHTVEPVDGYTLRDWDRILPDMAKETKLDPAQTADLRAYVLTAHLLMSSPPSKQSNAGGQ